LNGTNINDFVVLSDRMHRMFPLHQQSFLYYVAVGVTLGPNSAIRAGNEYTYQDDR